ncbi:MAG: MFS transporter [Acidimicrobiales bacterium]|nr:MFS transporter [Acidimicrobiales bacterium]
MTDEALETQEIDAKRLRSLVGLTAGQLGPRAYAAINGLLLTLLVGSHQKSALGVTFAITSGRLLNWITYPLIGRLSDKGGGKIGRRAPYMGISLIVMGICVALFPSAPSYWALVGLIVIVRQANAVLTITGVAVVPETVGRSRWIKTIGVMVIGAVMVSVAIKGTVLETWDQSKVSTWSAPFHLAGLMMAVAGLLVLFTVREASAALEVAKRDKKESKHLKDDIKVIFKQPGASVLAAGAFIFWAGIGGTISLSALFYENECHASASAQTVAGVLGGLAAVFIGIPIGYWIAKRVNRRTIAILAPLGGTVLLGSQFFITSIWQSVGLSAIGAPLLMAYLIAVGPLMARLLPSSGGLGERFGVLLSPFTFVSVVSGFMASVLVDHMNHQYKWIWLFPAVAGILQFLVMFRLRIPEANTKVKSLKSVRSAIKSFRSRSKDTPVTLIGGTVTAEDADGTLLFDHIRNWVSNNLDKSINEENSEHETEIIDETKN